MRASGWAINRSLMVRKNFADEGFFELKTFELPDCVTIHQRCKALAKPTALTRYTELISYAIRKKRFRRRFPEHQPAGRPQFELSGLDQAPWKNEYSSYWRLLLHTWQCLRRQ